MTAGAARLPGPSRLLGFPRLPGISRLPRRWLPVFGVSLALFVIRLMVPTPVGQADNHDGGRLMCDLGLRAVVPHGYPRWFSYAYFSYVPRGGCNRIPVYPSSQVVPLGIARVLTPVLGLPGALNLIVLGLGTCVIIAFAIATLATGLRIRPWAQLAVAAGLWLIMADAAFFDLVASPFSEPAALVGMLLVAAGVVYLGRGRRETVFGLVVAGIGGLLAALSKEQYLILAIPICLTIFVAGAAGSGKRGLARLRTRRAAGAAAVAGIIAVSTAAYWSWDSSSRHAARLHHEQAIDMIFMDIVNRHDNARADLRTLGLPASWAKSAGHDSWSKPSVLHDPLYRQYEAKLSEGNIAHYLLTHPGAIVRIGQRAAVLAQHFRVTYLGNYPPSAGHPPGARESRVVVLTWLVHRLPPGLGLLWLVPLWVAMVALAAVTLFLRRGGTWHRDGAVLVLCLTGCAVAAFIPPAYFAGISITRHMVGMNLATALAFTVSIALASSMIYRGLSRLRQRGPAGLPHQAPASAPPPTQASPPGPAPEPEPQSRS